ncbi:MAG: ABC transporter permease [Clostridiales Family XIII bacterium]|jgi:ABC-2 type transport system permease protein|nr:ABC transporter permease [Clostridiales Family XIII bacterium]
MRALAIRVVTQIRNDRRSMAMLIVAPVFVLTLIFFLLADSDYVPKILVDEDGVPAPLVQAIYEQDAAVEACPAEALGEPEKYLRGHPDVDLIVTAPKLSQETDGQGIDGNGMISSVVDVQGAGSQTAGGQSAPGETGGGEGLDFYMLESNVKSRDAISAISDAQVSLNPSSEVRTHTVYGSADDSTFDSLGYIFPGVFTFFFVFIISGMTLVRERSGGTLERLMMTPIRRFEVIMGYSMGIGVFAAIQAVVIVCYTIYVLRLESLGSVALIILAMMLLAFTAVSFGALVSIFATTEFQIVQFIPVVVVPQVFFSGIIPLETIPYGLGNLCYIMPMYYGCRAMKEIAVYGYGLQDIWPYLVALVCYALALGVLNTLALRKYRVV